MNISYKKKIKVEDYIIRKIIKLQNKSSKTFFFKIMAPDIYDYVRDIVNQKINYNKIKNEIKIITKLKFETSTIKKNSYLVFLKSLFTKEKYLPPLLLKNKSAFTWVQNEFFQDYAFQNNIKLFQSRKYDWFPNIIEDPKIKFKNKEINFLINLIEKILLKIDKKISLNAHEERKVVNDLNYLQFWCEKNLENLRQKKLPKIFFSGTMRSALNRLMSFVIQEKGGSTIVFEHGCGAGIMYDYGFVWDLIYSSKFITNKKTVGHSPSLLKFYQRKKIFKSKVKIGYFKSSLIKNKKFFFNNKISKAMFVLTTTNDNVFQHGPGMISVNQTIFLISQIKDIFISQNIEFILKLHPEENSKKLISYCKKNSIKIVDGNLENMDLSDTIFLFENITTTSFYNLFFLNCPIIILHNPLRKFIYKAYLKIKRRATIYNLRLIRDKFYINKSELTKKIKKLQTNSYEKYQNKKYSSNW